MGPAPAAAGLAISSRQGKGRNGLALDTKEQSRKSLSSTGIGQIHSSRDSSAMVFVYQDRRLRRRPARQSGQAGGALRQVRAKQIFFRFMQALQAAFQATIGGVQRVIGGLIDYEVDHFRHAGSFHSGGGLLQRMPLASDEAQGDTRKSDLGFVEIQDLRRRKIGKYIPLAWTPLHDALPRQTGERFANGRDAEADLGREILYAEALKRESAVPNGSRRAVISSSPSADERVLGHDCGFVTLFWTDPANISGLPAAFLRALHRKAADGA